MALSHNRRIALNVVATYGRSLYKLAIGLISGRWTLLALGKVDYGLMGLVGGLTHFVDFFNRILGHAVGRFYAVNVGAAKKSGNREKGLENCRKWFNTALSIHTILPLVLVVAGYPVGVWAVRHFLTIPPERIEACVWVWRFTCFSCFIGMVSVPFRAMYTAKQEIAELTIYSLLSTTLQFLFLLYMHHHPQPLVWLPRLVAWQCVVNLCYYGMLVARAMIRYPECRFRARYLWNPGNYLELLHYVGARFFSEVTTLVSSQGRSILVNKYMGPAYNASMSVGNSLSSHALTFSSSISSAFWPAIANKAGEGDVAEVKRLSFMTCRISAVMLLVFVLPLSLEADNVLRLWLKSPPDFAATISTIVMARAVLERLTEGYWMAIMGMDKGVMRYSFTVGMAGIVTVAISWILFAMGFGMWSVCIGLIASKFIVVAVRVWLGRELVRFPIWHWIRRVFLPIFFLSLVTLVSGIAIRLGLVPSLSRVVLTTLACEVVFVPGAWFLVLEDSERSYFLRKLNKMIRR